MSAHIHRLAAPVAYTGQTGAFPGQESFIEIGKETKASMIFCWCPPPPPGFLIGSPPTETGRYDDEQQRVVSFTGGFWMAKHPVTQAQWRAIMGDNPSRKATGDELPVDSVSWHRAKKFCDEAELRLPREDEWEYACRAGSPQAVSVGTGTALNSQLANFNGNHPWGQGKAAFKWLDRETTTPVASFPPNAWGLHDMHGQLWEWCEDANDSAGRQRVLRGGSWISHGWNARSAIRLGLAPVLDGDDVGFRACPRSIRAGAGGNKGAERPKE